VLFSWGITYLKDIYTSYIIERSENGTDFHSISSTPIVDMNGTSKKQMFYAATLETNDTPYFFRIYGINAFGEELIMDNAEQGLAYACKETGAEVLEYTAAPVFMDAEAKCRHQWLIEFAHKPADLNAFAKALDLRLQQLNSDYEAKRHKDITLQQLEVVEARQGLFNDWLKSKGKLGGQHKVPRLSNSRKNIEELLKMN